MTIESLMNRTVTVERASVSRDSAGGRVETWASHLAGVPIRIQPLSAFERERAGNTGNEVITHKAYMPDYRDVIASDRLTGTHPFSGASEVFVVRGQYMTDHDGRLQVLELEQQR